MPRVIFAAVIISAALLAQPFYVRPRVALVGDGTTDNTTIINTAMANPIQIYVPCGTYLFSVMSVTADNVLVVGQGECSVFKAKADSASLFNANGHTGVAIQNLRFDLSNAPKSTLSPGTAVFTNVTMP